MFSPKKAIDYKAIFEAQTIAQAVISFTVSGEILSVNENFLNVMGYREVELIGRHHSLFCEPDYVESDAYRDFWRDLAAGKAQVREVKRLKKDGGVIWLQATYAPVKNSAGKVVSVVKIASDISALKAATLNDRSMIEAVKRVQAVIEFQPDGTILTANDIFLNLFQYSLQDIKGLHHSRLCEDAYVASPEYKAFWQALTNGDFQAGEFKRLGRGGAEIYIQASYNPIFDERGKVVKVVKFATDMTADVTRRLRNAHLSATIFDDLKRVVGEIQAVTSFMVSTSSASEETSVTVEAVAAAAEELSKSVNEISQSMVAAKENVENVFKQTEGVTQAAAKLKATANAMNGIIGLIQDIANQINLLALNATIESARAGEAGRGFAVVATEVKTLAKQASNASKTIAEEIASMQSISDEVGGLLSVMQENLQHVLHGVTSVASAISQQTSATDEISNNMQAASLAVGEIQQNIQQVNHSINQVSTSADKVRGDVAAVVS